MRKFWGFYDNGQYRVGCNGGTVYVYDQEEKELAKFKDIPHAYVGAFQPETNIFVAKSTAGALAVYDLDQMKLIRKIKITRMEAQDEGFAFSPDGQFFYNIEKPVRSTDTQLTVYRTSDYEKEKVLFEENDRMFLTAIEFDKCTKEGYVLGFMRGENRVMEYGFIGKFTGDDVFGIKRIPDAEYDYIHAYKDWEKSGYTPKKLEWCRVREYDPKPHVSLKQTYDGQIE